MPSYLGLYIEDNMIKYAKVTKEKEKVKIDSSGIKFYTNVTQAIKQIIEETYSYKTPISINLTEETYQYFNMFSLLNKKDLDKSIKLEFETYCSDKGYNADSLETRYAIVNNAEDKERLKVINICANKIELNKVQQRVEGYRVGAIVPLSMTIPNLINFQEKENALIVNIDDKTTITTVIDGNVYHVEKMDEGSKGILEKINLRENSYSKAYEICQNTTIYTSETQDFVEEQGRYLEEIMPTLYTIVGKTQKIINESVEKINKVYITGTLSCVNNIDLYFQEYLGKVKCEILKPYFVQNMVKEMNIKEYVEVNDALSLALQGLGEGINGINFKKRTLSEDIKNLTAGMKSKEGKDGKEKKFLNINFNFDDFSSAISRTEAGIIRGIVTFGLFAIIFSTISIMLMKQIREKEAEVGTITQSINAEISKIQSDTSSLNLKSSKYDNLTNDLKKVNEKISDLNASKNLIPNLLNQIMSVIDETVQITSIENNSGKHIVITAQSEKYPGLGYFKTKLKTQGILKDVVSGSSVKQGGMITVKIEGELP